MKMVYHILVTPPILIILYAMLEIQVDIVSDKKKLADDFAIKLDVIAVVA